MKDVNGKTTIQTPGGRLEEAAMSEGASEVSLPKSFPSDIPIMSGMTLLKASFFQSDKGTSITAVWTTKTIPIIDVFGFYKRALQEQGWQTKVLQYNDVSGSVTFSESSIKPEQNRRSGILEVDVVDGMTSILLSLIEPK